MKGLITELILLITIICPPVDQIYRSDDQQLFSTGFVLDFSELAGCRYIIELDNGERLNPIEIVPEFEFKDSLRVKLKYTILDDMVSSCMVGKIVRIERIEKINEQSSSGDSVIVIFLQKIKSFFSRKNQSLFYK